MFLCRYETGGKGFGVLDSTKNVTCHIFFFYIPDFAQFNKN